jgi:hypothetical protein
MKYPRHVDAYTSIRDRQAYVTKIRSVLMNPGRGFSRRKKGDCSRLRLDPEAPFDTAHSSPISQRPPPRSVICVLTGAA